MFEIGGGISRADQRVVYDVLHGHYQDLITNSNSRITRAEAATHDDTTIFERLFIDEAQFPTIHVKFLSRVAFDDAVLTVGLAEMTPEDFGAKV